MNLIDYADLLLVEGLNPLPLNENKSPKLPKGHNYLYSMVNESNNIYLK